MAKGAPIVHANQLAIIKRKAVNRQSLTKFEIRALYSISQDLFSTWMEAIDDVNSRIKDWKNKRTFTPAEIRIIIDNFGESDDWNQ